MQVLLYAFFWALIFQRARSVCSRYMKSAEGSSSQRWQYNHLPTDFSFWRWCCEMMWEIDVSCHVPSVPPPLSPFTDIFGRMVKYNNLYKKWLLNLSCHQDGVGMCVRHKSWQPVNMDLRNQMNYSSTFSPLWQEFSFFSRLMITLQCFPCLNK